MIVGNRKSLGRAGPSRCTEYPLTFQGELARGQGGIGRRSWLVIWDHRQHFNAVWIWIQDKGNIPNLSRTFPKGNVTYPSRVVELGQVGCREKGQSVDSNQIGLEIKKEGRI